MNTYKVVVLWADGDRWTYFYDARGITSAMNMLNNEFMSHSTAFEIISVEKQED